MAVPQATAAPSAVAGAQGFPPLPVARNTRHQANKSILVNSQTVSCILTLLFTQYRLRLLRDSAKLIELL
ncbi:hypothetical protein, partial [Mycobacterium basiliense]